MKRALLNFLKTNEYLDTLIRRNPYYYKKAAEGFARWEQQTLEERMQWQNEAIRQTLQAARNTNYGAHDAASLQDWPILSKETVRDRPADFVAVASARKVRIPASTGGTSGVPLKLYRSLRSVTYEQAAIDWITQKHGYTLDRARVAVLRGESIKPIDDHHPPYWAYTHSGKRLVLSSNHLNTHTAAYYWRELERFRPEVLLAYPSCLENLLALIEHAAAPVRIPYVFTSSEVLSSVTRMKAQRQLQAKLIDLYGQAERVAMAYGIEEHEYRFVPGYSIVELQFHSSDTHHDLYEVIGTGVWNEVMPLVRYRTGDLIRVDQGATEAQLKEIAFGLRPFHSIVGRMNDYLVTKDGGRLVGIDHIPRGIQHMVQMQIIQLDWTEVEIHIVPGPLFSMADEQQILRNAREKIPESIHIRILKKEQLIRSSSGKLPYVIRHVNEPSSPSAPQHP